MMLADRTLEDAIKECFSKRRASILVVDDKCDIGAPHDRTYEEHVVNEGDCERFAMDKEVDLKLWDMSHERAQNPGEFFMDAPYDIILVNAATANKTIDLVSLAKSASTAGRLESKFPNAQIYYLLPNSGYAPLDEIIESVSRLLFKPAGNIHKIQMPIAFPTAMHFLCYVLTGRMEGSKQKLSALQHDYKNQMWKENYLPFIDTSLRAGNNQTSIPYKFLVLSNKECALLGDHEVSADEKVKVQKMNYRITDDDLENCAAIFVDNSWNNAKHSGALGDGIKTLRKLNIKLQGKRIPIIYQSAHKLEDFTEQEKAEIEKLGAVLAAKDIFPKVCKGKAISEKEIEVSRLLQQHPVLANYTSRVHNFSKSGKDNLYVICSKIITDRAPETAEKTALFSRLGIEDNAITHKMYVLSLFHSYLKDQLDNEKLKATSKDFFSINEMKAKAPKYSELLDKIRPVYEKIVEEHRKLAPAIISHNDAKWDNWLNGNVLGDFGSVQPGTEYKDIAKALLEPADDFKAAQNDEIIGNAVNAYISLRKAHDKSFKPGENFKKRVYDMLITESLRTLSYKSDQDVADGLANTVKNHIKKY